jgi:hypothetical protein
MAIQLSRVWNLFILTSSIVRPFVGRFDQETRVS